MAVRQSKLVWEKHRFFDLVAMAMEKSKKKLNAMNKPLHPSTNPKILVKISPLGSKLPGLESRRLKFFLNKEKTLAKYIALSASLPSGLNKNDITL